MALALLYEALADRNLDSCRTGEERGQFHITSIWYYLSSFTDKNEDICAI